MIILHVVQTCTSSEVISNIMRSSRSASSHSTLFNKAHFLVQYMSNHVDDIQKDGLEILTRKAVASQILIEPHGSDNNNKYSTPDNESSIASRHNGLIYD